MVPARSTASAAERSAAGTATCSSGSSSTTNTRTGTPTDSCVIEMSSSPRIVGVMNGHAAHSPALSPAFRVLGPLEVDGPDGTQIDVGGGKPATVLALLLLHRNAWVSIEQLIDAVWSGREVPASAQNNLKTYVWQLRRALPDDRIESRPGAYRVRVLSGELDADAASALGDEARALLARGSAAEAVTVVQQALGLWRGCPYDGLT